MSSPSPAFAPVPCAAGPWPWGASWLRGNYRSRALAGECPRPTSSCRNGRSYWPRPPEFQPTLLAHRPPDELADSPLRGCVSSNERLRVAFFGGELLKKLPGWVHWSRRRASGLAWQEEGWMEMTRGFRLAALANSREGQGIGCLGCLGCLGSSREAEALSGCAPSCSPTPGLPRGAAQREDRSRVGADGVMLEGDPPRTRGRMFRIPSPVQN